ncbi:MAG: family 20 glycosylhydrolase [Caldithrix sp.]|nr:family 20 glycosylhydrolase [Caldithrix sp.]
MKRLLVFSAVVLLTFVQCAKKELTQLPIVPQPDAVEEMEGHFVFDEATRVVYPHNSDGLQTVIDFMKELMEPATGFPLSAEQGPVSKTHAINLVIDPSIKGPQGSYRLQVQPDHITIRAAAAVGLFYGVQTLRQLMPVAIEQGNDKTKAIQWQIPALEIEDSPSFSYRGLHLDVCRHMFPVKFIKKYIDLLALHKMNRFHWHLTEDQGWRIEIKQYPKLTEIGAYRDETLIGHATHPPYEYDNKRYGGYYTQEEVKEIVRYAQSRFITIIPEIEMPGHSRAALASYPELGCTGGPYEVATRWGIFKDIYCAGNEKTFEFLQNVLSEVIDLFPGQYIHIGGDEAPKERWRNCDKCQARIREEGLEDEHELQSYFIKRMEKFLLSKGRSIIGWDEILEGGLAPQATVMSWRGVQGGIAAARHGNDVIMTPTSHCYFDYYQTDPENEPLAIGGYTTLKEVYHFNPIPQVLTAEEAKHILGVQGNVWTEYINTPDHVEYMAYPRACALSEVGWTKKENRNYVNFLNRMDRHYKRLDALDVNYFYEVPRPKPSTSNLYFLDTGELTLETDYPDAEIYYTLDGSEPDRQSSLYSGPLTFDESLTLKAKTIRTQNDESSLTLKVNIEKLAFIDGLADSSVEPGLDLWYFKRLLPNAAALDSVQAADKLQIRSISMPSFVKDTTFGLWYKGYLKVPKKGLYKFRLSSDDGSILRLHDKIIVDNDGFHWMQAKEGPAALKPGLHPFDIRYFNGFGGGQIRLEYAYENEPFIEVPREMLFHSKQ